MPTRVLDWNGLCRVAGRPNPPDRLVRLAGLPARVVPSRGTDCGFYVRTESDASGRADGYWALRTTQELLLLQELVAAGQVTVDDEEDPFRLAEWGALVGDLTRGCFVAGCAATAQDIDQRGPVFDDQHRMHKACPRHWEGIMAVVGEQATAEHDAAQGGAGGPVVAPPEYDIDGFLPPGGPAVNATGAGEPVIDPGRNFPPAA